MVREKRLKPPTYYCTELSRFVKTGNSELCRFDQTGNGGLSLLLGPS
jgi:hypothetical protein